MNRKSTEIGTAHNLPTNGYFGQFWRFYDWSFGLLALANVPFINLQVAEFCQGKRQWHGFSWRVHCSRRHWTLFTNMQQEIFTNNVTVSISFSFASFAQWVVNCIGTLALYDGNKISFFSFITCGMPWRIFTSIGKHKTVYVQPMLCYLPVYFKPFPVCTMD